jgi:[ribosomal protein S18]-alanine N-acetyltransferase
VTLEFRQMSQADAEEIARWRYEGAYAFYDADADADDLALLLSADVRENRYFSAITEDGSLVGFFEFKQDGTTIELGLGLRPDHTGRGSGLAFVETGMAFARERFRPQRFRLAVATFNERAIRVYERAGFMAVRTYDHATAGSVYRFLEMQRPVDE